MIINDIKKMSFPTSARVVTGTEDKCQRHMRITQFLSLHLLTQTTILVACP